MTVQRPRLAWWVSWTAFALGVSASVAANIAHAEPSTTGRLVAAWPPLALLLTVEMLSRVPAPRRRWFAALRYLATVVVAAVAAIASYRHMVGLTLNVGEDRLTAYTLPLSVDGTVLVASLCLLALSDLRPGTPARKPVIRAAAARQPVVPPAALTLPLLPRQLATVDTAAMAAGLVDRPPAWPGNAPAGVTVLPLRTAAAPAAPVDPAGAGGSRATGRGSRAKASGGSSSGYDQAEVDARKETARKAFRDARGRDTPLSGLELGHAFGRSERWGRDRIAEVKAEDDAARHDLTRTPPRQEPDDAPHGTALALAAR